MTEGEIITIIGSAASVLVCLVSGFFAFLASRAAKATEWQTVNDHKENLRDNLDRIEKEVVKSLADIKDQLRDDDKKIDRIEVRLDGVRDNTDTMYKVFGDRMAAFEQRLQNLEKRPG